METDFYMVVEEITDFRYFFHTLENAREFLWEMFINSLESEETAEMIDTNEEYQNLIKYDSIGNVGHIETCYWEDIA